MPFYQGSTDVFPSLLQQQVENLIPKTAPSFCSCHNNIIVKMPPGKPQIKYCSYGACSNNSSKTSTDCVRYIPYPKPTTLLGLERAKRWIINCNRQDMALDNINEHTYVCSQHFVCPTGPTNSNPDPVPTTATRQRRMPMKKAEHVCNKQWTHKLHMTQMKCSQDTSSDTLEHSQLSSAEIERHALLLDAVTVEDGIHADVSIGPTITGQNAQVQTVAQDNNVPANHERERDHHESSHDVHPMTTPSTTCPQSAIISTLYDVMQHCKGWYMKYELGSDSQITASLVKWVERRTLLTVTVVAKHETLQISLMVDNIQVDRNHQLWSEITVENLPGMRNFLDNLSTWNICINLHSQSGLPHPTTCKALVQPPSVMCPGCTTKYQIQATNSKRCAKPSATMQSVLRLQHKHMDKESLCLKLNYITKRSACYRKQIARLKSWLISIIADHGGTLHEAQNDDFVQVLEEHTKGTTDNHRMFLEEQLKIAKENKHGNEHKWHPLVIKWCIYMMKKSKKGYKSLRNSGFITLPSERTLRRHCVNFQKQ